MDEDSTHEDGYKKEGKSTAQVLLVRMIPSPQPMPTLMSQIQQLLANTSN